MMTTNSGESPRISVSAAPVAPITTTSPRGGSSGWSATNTLSAVHRQIAVTISKPEGLTEDARNHVIGVSATATPAISARRRLQRAMTKALSAIISAQMAELARRIR